MEINYDKQYFDSLMEKAAEEGADPTIMEDAKKAFKFAPKGVLQKLFASDPKEFYANYANLLCSAAMDHRTSHTALGNFLSKAKYYEGKENNPHGFFYNSIRYVAATLLGLVKFAWDVTMITAAFAGRFASRLVMNVSKAVVQTVKETSGDGKEALHQINESFRRNIIPRKEEKTHGTKDADVTICI